MAMKEIEKSIDLTELVSTGTPTSSSETVRSSVSVSTSTAMNDDERSLGVSNIDSKNLTADYMNQIANITNCENELSEDEINKVIAELDAVGSYQEAEEDGEREMASERLETLVEPQVVLAEYCCKCGKEYRKPEDAIEHSRSHVIRGDFSQNVFTHGNPCTAVAAIFIVYASRQNVSSFTSTTIDEILCGGYEFYKLRRRELQTAELNLTATEVAGCYPGLYPGSDDEITISVQEEESMNGMMNIVTSPVDIARLETSVNEFLSSDQKADSRAASTTNTGNTGNNSKFAIITTNLLSMAIVAQDDIVYLFDSHMRDDFGRTCFDSNIGKACIVTFNRIFAPFAISDHIHDNCLFTIPPVSIENVSSEDMQYFQYSITPVIISSSEPKSKS